MPCRQRIPVKVGAMPLVRPLAWNFGHSPLLKKKLLRQGIALPHIAAAKPGRAMTSDFGGRSQEPDLFGKADASH